jgi:hypothetical protein
MVVEPRSCFFGSDCCYSPATAEILRIFTDHMHWAYTGVQGARQLIF